MFTGCTKLATMLRTVLPRLLYSTMMSFTTSPPLPRLPPLTPLLVVVVVAGVPLVLAGRSLAVAVVAVAVAVAVAVVAAEGPCHPSSRGVCPLLTLAHHLPSRAMQMLVLLKVQEQVDLGCRSWANKMMAKRAAKKQDSFSKTTMRAAKRQSRTSSK